METGKHWYRGGSGATDWKSWMDPKSADFDPCLDSDHEEIAEPEPGDGFWDMVWQNGPKGRISKVHLDGYPKHGVCHTMCGVRVPDGAELIYFEDHDPDDDFSPGQEAEWDIKGFKRCEKCDRRMERMGY